MIRTIFLTGVFVLFATMAVGGEYYQYTDESGNLRFTDDMTQIPETQRDAVEKFTAETASANGTEADSGAVVSEQESPETTAPTESAQYDIPGHQTLNVKAEELNRIQEELNRTRAALETERSELQAQAPAENATVTDKIAYSMRVEALNDKIDAYEKDLKAFEQKVQAFNNPGPPAAQQEQ
jgi:chromosome segregation ATPase